MSFQYVKIVYGSVTAEKLIVEDYEAVCCVRDMYAIEVK